MFVPRRLPVQLILLLEGAHRGLEANWPSDKRVPVEATLVLFVIDGYNSLVIFVAAADFIPNFFYVPSRQLISNRDIAL